MDGRSQLNIEGLHNIIDGFYAFQILNAAVKFDLFTLLEKALTREEVMHALRIAEQPARILLLGCVSLGLVQKNGDRYQCSDVATMTLRRGSLWDLRSLVTFGHEVSYRAMWRFHDALRENTNCGLRELPGCAPTLYEQLGSNPEIARAFKEMMTTVSTIVADSFVKAIDLSGGGHLVDVGGGAATNAIALAQRWPQLEITILDLPSVVPSAVEAIDRAGLRDRIRAIGADCFEVELPSCTHVLFAHFLEIWSPDQIKRLLAKAHRSVAPGGMIYLVNLLQDDDEMGPSSAASVSAYFLTIASGRGMAYTAKEYESWLGEAGFEPLHRAVLSRAHSLVIGGRQ